MGEVIRYTVQRTPTFLRLSPVGSELEVNSKQADIDTDHGGVIVDYFHDWL